MTLAAEHLMSTSNRRAVTAPSPLQTLREKAAAFADLPERGTAELVHRVTVGLHEMCVEILRLERLGVHRDVIREVLKVARRRHATSPFVRRLQEWPHGYPGDWETVEYICDARANADEGTLTHAIEWYTLNTAVAQQHRNKVQWQAEQAAAIAGVHSSGAQILSVGCGGARDLWSAARNGTLSKCSITLNDLDSAALAFARSRLDSLVREVRLVPGNALRTSITLGRARCYDLILIGGLLDYLDLRRATHVITHLSGALRPGGQICFTNIGTGNPYRPWMEYLADWSLTERTRAQMAELGRLAVEPDGDIEITQDETGLAWLVRCGPTIGDESRQRTEQ